MFLQGSGSTLVAIPFLASLLPRETWAQSATAPRRFISIFSDLDYGHNSVWLPNGTANITNIPQPSRTYVVGGGHHDIRYQALRDFAPSATSSLTRLHGTSLSPYLESVSILRSLDYCDIRGHDSSRLLGGARLYSQNEAFGTNWKAIPTIDHVINNNRTFNPNGLPLMFGGMTPGITGNSWSYAPATGSGVTAIVPIDVMQSFWNSLFRSGSFPESGVATPAHPRRAILGSVIDDFKRVMNSRNISSLDKAALSNAMDKLSDVQRGLSQGSTAQCSYKGLTKNLDMYKVSNIAANGKALADMIVASIMCDSARVFNLALSDEYTQTEVLPLQNVDLHQNVSHTPFATYNGRAAWTYMADTQAAVFKNFIAPLVQGLSAATDPSNGKSYLYNSLIMAAPSSGQTHGKGSLPVTLIGNAGGNVPSGNYVDFADRAKGAFAGCDSMNDQAGNASFSNNWYGVSYNRLLVTILQGMGLTPSDYEDNTLNTQLYNKTDIGTLNANVSNIGGYGYATAVDIRNRPAGDYFVDEARESLPKYDLKQFKNKLPIPG